MTAWGPTWLFVPGDRPDRFPKAVSSGADQVLIDLEDGVADGRKVVAREAAARWLGSDGRAWVRVNAAGTPWHDDDLALAGLPGCAGVVLPKAESALDVDRASEAAGGPGRVVALVETAVALVDLPALARARGMALLALGNLDLARDLGCEPEHEPLLHARSSLVVASRAAGLPAPVDGVTLETTDETAVTRDARAAARLGFGGKLCIHPAQVAAVSAAFLPSAEQVVWAERISAAVADEDGGPIVVDGQMVDRPVVLRAHAILDRARERRR